MAFSMASYKVNTVTCQHFFLIVCLGIQVSQSGAARSETSAAQGRTSYRNSVNPQERGSRLDSLSHSTLGSASGSQASQLPSGRDDASSTSRSNSETQRQQFNSGSLAKDSEGPLSAAVAELPSAAFALLASIDAGAEAASETMEEPSIDEALPESHPDITNLPLTTSQLPLSTLDSGLANDSSEYQLPDRSLQDYDPPPQAQSANPRDRLAAIILITDFAFKNGDRIGSLKLVVRLMGINLFPYTPTDVYIFTLPQVGRRMVVLAVTHQEVCCAFGVEL